MLHLEIVIQYLASEGNPKENFHRNEIISFEVSNKYSSKVWSDRKVPRKNLSWNKAEFGPSIN